MEQVGVISLALTIKVLDEIRAILKDSAERFDSWEPTASDQESLSSTETWSPSFWSPKWHKFRSLDQHVTCTTGSNLNLVLVWRSRTAGVLLRWLCLLVLSPLLIHRCSVPHSCCTWFHPPLPSFPPSSQRNWWQRLNYFRLKGRLIVPLWNGRLNSWDIVFDQRSEVWKYVREAYVLVLLLPNLCYHSI